MIAVRLRLYGELNDFVARPRREVEFTVRLRSASSVKDFIEAQGVPHPEIGALLRGGTALALDAPLSEGDPIEVYPCSGAPQPSPLPTCLPEGEPRFVLDVHLGTLAGYLRLLGFDTFYRNDTQDEELAEISAEQGRVLLTRDVGLLKRSVVVYGRFVRARQPEQQLHEIVRRYGLTRWARPFTRCLRCNGLLLTVAKSAVQDRLPERVAQEIGAFRQCAGCGRVYWEGSHMQRMRELVDGALAADHASPMALAGGGPPSSTQ